MELKVKSSIYHLIPELAIIVNPELKDEFVNLLPEKLDEQRIIENLKKELSDADIEEQIHSIRNITLNITDNCCFRCSYCTYSGIYKGPRIHGSKKMSFETAQKMIERLITWITGEKRKIKIKSINIGFYGGEALIEIELIKNIIDYIKKRFREKPIDNKFNAIFRFPTNGYLLNESVVDFLVMNNITIDVSLDGPREEHDKFRIHKKGEKTFDTVWNNLEGIMKRYPNYYKEKVNFLCTLHPLHRFENIDRFFLENPEYFQIDRINAYPMNMLFLKKKIERKIVENKKNQTCKIERIKACERLDDKMRLRTLGYDTKFTTMCFPGGAKLFVASDGTFHVCEKVKPNFCIGDVENGIDYGAVRKIYRGWNDEIIKNRCWECACWSFCAVCLSQNQAENGIKFDCKFKNKPQEILLEYLSFKKEADVEKNREPIVKPGNIREYVQEL